MSTNPVNQPPTILDIPDDVMSDYIFKRLLSHKTAEDKPRVVNKGYVMHKSSDHGWKTDEIGTEFNNLAKVCTQWRRVMYKNFPPKEVRFYESRGTCLVPVASDETPLITTFGCRTLSVENDYFYEKILTARGDIPYESQLFKLEFARVRKEHLNQAIYYFKMSLGVFAATLAAVPGVCIALPVVLHLALIVVVIKIFIIMFLVFLIAAQSGDRAFDLIKTGFLGKPIWSVNWNALIKYALIIGAVLLVGVLLKTLYHLARAAILDIQIRLSDRRLHKIS